MKISEVVSPETERPPLFSSSQKKLKFENCDKIEHMPIWQVLQNTTHAKKMGNVKMTIGALKNPDPWYQGF